MESPANTTVLLPYHQDERLSERSISLPTDVVPTVIDPDLPEAGQWQRLVTLYEAHAGRVAEGVAGGSIRVATGDCLSAVGTLVGLQRAGLDPSVVWFDAHGDVHTLESSTSGYLGGLPLRMVLGGDYAVLGEPLGLQVVPEGHAVLVDARDLDPPEERFLADSEVTVTTVDEVSVADLPDGPILLHVDLDVIDAPEIPGLRFPAAHGPQGWQVVTAVERLVGSGRVAALEVACPWFEPMSDDDVRRRADVLASFLAISLA